MLLLYQTSQLLGTSLSFPAGTSQPTTVKINFSVPPPSLTFQNFPSQVGLFSQVVAQATTKHSHMEISAEMCASSSGYDPLKDMDSGPKSQRSAYSLTPPKGR